MRGIAIGHQAPQDSRRGRPAIDQVAQQVQRVAAGRKADLLQQPPQGGVAALDVANEVVRHQRCER
jgi:hypothetical protein